MISYEYLVQCISSSYFYVVLPPHVFKHLLQNCMHLLLLLQKFQKVVFNQTRFF